jgi:hypothetical protein
VGTPPPPPPPFKVKSIKRREIQFLGNCVLHSKTIAQTMEFFLSESLGEDVNSFHSGRAVMKIDDPVMNQIPDKIHMDINVFCLLSLYWISI